MPAVGSAWPAYLLPFLRAFGKHWWAPLSTVFGGAACYLVERRFGVIPEKVIIVVVASGFVVAAFMAWLDAVRALEIEKAKNAELNKCAPQPVFSVTGNVINIQDAKSGYGIEANLKNHGPGIAMETRVNGYAFYATKNSELNRASGRRETKQALGDLGEDESKHIGFAIPGHTGQISMLYLLFAVEYKDACGTQRSTTVQVQWPDSNHASCDWLTKTPPLESERVIKAFHSTTGNQS